MHSGLPKRCDHLPIVRLVEERRIDWATTGPTSGTL